MKMKFRIENPTGRVSIDRQVKRLLDHVNRRLTETKVGPRGWTDDEQAVRWARDTIEQGIKNIAGQFEAQRIE